MPLYGTRLRERQVSIPVLISSLAYEAQNEEEKGESTSQPTDAP